MIVSSDIYKILFDKVKEIGIADVYDGWNPIKSKLKKEAAVIITSTPVSPDTYWERAYVHVNICVPDYLAAMPSTIPLSRPYYHSHTPPP